MIGSERVYIGQRNIVISVAAGLVLLFSIFSPLIPGLTRDGQLMLGILIVAVLLWVFETIPMAMTSLLVIILQPILGIANYKTVFASFGNQALFFLIGAFILAGAIEKHNLHKRIALLFLRRFESSPKVFTLGVMLCSALLSFIMPEHAVAAFMLPILIAVLVSMRLAPKESNFGKVTVLAIAYGCSIGSLGTLIGGARNPLTIAYLDETVGVKVTFFEWMRISMPIVFISLFLVWLILVFAFKIELKDLADGKKSIEEQVRRLGPLSPYEKITITVMAGTVFLWVTVSDVYGVAVIAIFGALLLFFTGVLKWEDIERRVPWAVVLVYGGAISLGLGLMNTGVAGWIADKLLWAIGGNAYVAVMVIILMTILLTNLMSNTGAVALLLPIGAALAADIAELNPTMTSFLIGLSGGLAFMLVIATPGNLITYSSGYFSQKDLFKAGALANVACIFVVFAIAITYWKFIGLW